MLEDKKTVTTLGSRDGRDGKKRLELQTSVMTSENVQLFKA